MHGPLVNFANRSFLTPRRALGMLCCAAALASFSIAAEPSDKIDPSELELVKQAEQARINTIGQVYGAVVAVYGNDRQGGGSGVVIDANGLALTNHHVVAAAGVEGWAGLADGKFYRWRIVGVDPGGDLALIQLRGQPQFPAAPLGDSRHVRVGDWAMAMGNPFTLAEDQQPTVTLGIVSGVDRYQGGAGENTLVYGRCFQVDSSINPGNSGGGLFNLRGQLIGINGRASFEERGRVNVGAGYAISIEQAVKFLPDLLATRMAQHGTLDAVFGNRERGVICHTLNLDSLAAQQGLELGDRLLEFEGETIRNANQFTNIVSTLPADWPASLVVERAGAKRTLHVRLAALPYADEAPPESPEKKPAEPKLPLPKRPNAAQAKPNFGKPGEPRDVKLNHEFCQALLANVRQKHGFATAQAEFGWRLDEEHRRGNELLGQGTLFLTSSGKFHYELVLKQETRRFGFDGERFWRQPAAANNEAVLPGLLLDPLAAQALVLASLASPHPFAEVGGVELEGSDKAAGVAAYRVRIAGPANRNLFVWLSVLGSSGELAPRLLKVGPSRNSEAPLLAVRFDAFETHAGMQWPKRRSLVKGIAEEVEYEIITTRISPASEFPAAPAATNEVSP